MWQEMQLVLNPGNWVVKRCVKSSQESCCALVNSFIKWDLAPFAAAFVNATGTRVVHQDAPQKPGRAITFEWSETRPAASRASCRDLHGSSGSKPSSDRPAGPGKLPLLTLLDEKR